MIVENGEWVVVRRKAEKDWWKPSTVLEDGESCSRPLKIIFNKPSNKVFEEAIPIGNGRLGAMVFGGVQSEILRLTEDTLWTGVPGNYTYTNGPAALADVRRLVDQGRYADASTYASLKLTAGHPQTFKLMGDMTLEFDDSHLKYDDKTYHRELDLDTATARVKYSVDDVEYTREHFASNPDQVIVTKISGSKPGSVSFTVSLAMYEDDGIITDDPKTIPRPYVKAENQIILEGYCKANKKIKDTKRIDPKGILYAAILKLQISEKRGTIRVLDGGKLQVEGSDWAVLHLVGSSSFDGPFTDPRVPKKNPTSEATRAIDLVNKLSYADLYARHLDDYQNLFHRVSLQLSKSSKNSSFNDTKSSAERVESFQTDEDPSLVELLFQFGRYLLISSSRPGTQVANLQGIWNSSSKPKWDAAPRLNINLQMNYWPALPCNLSELQEPLFDFMSPLSINGSTTAKVTYGLNGWLAHQATDIWAKTSQDVDDAVWSMWPMGGAWLCTHLWEHYMFTMDKDFLKNKAYPLLEGCVTFLLDWLFEGPGGYLGTNPSTSPEHFFITPDGRKASVSYSTTMDMTIIREVFSIIVSSAEVLGRNEDELVQRVCKAQPRLLPTKIARDGSVMEWAQDFEDQEVHHPHVSHLFGLFPGHSVTVEKNPDLSKAAGVTLYKRGVEGPGWSSMWKAALWARLHNSKEAYGMVKHLFRLVHPSEQDGYRGGIYANLFTAHPPFQIDANLGFSAVIAEMLVQSTINDLYLLPALPRDKWANGCVKGLKARGGVTVNISWKEGDLHEVGVWSKEHNSVKQLHYRGSVVNANIAPGTVYTFNRQLRCMKTYSLAEAASR